MYAGLGTLPAPSTIGVETINSTSMNVSWGSVPDYASYAVFNYGSYSATLNRSDSTSEVLNDLQHLMPYLVIVMTVSDDSYGASFTVHTLEAGSHINRMYFYCILYKYVCIYI